MQKNATRTSDIYARTSSRLRRALGLVGLGLASLGSGPCGSCPESYTECFTLEDLEAWHTQYIADFEASCASPATSGGIHAAGAAGAPGAPTRSNPCYEWDYQLLVAWDPNAGCPSEQQVNALDYEHQYITGEFLPRATQGETRPTCCREVHPDCPGGRPFLVAGRARVPELVGELSAADSGSVSGALALIWAQDGLTEYASVAAFARLTLQLMAFGAPPELVEASQQASLDEHRHARFCFAEAARHAGRGVEPGPLDMGQACDPVSFESFMLLNLVEGCVGETMAALRMAEQARLAAPPELAQALTEISEDETRHAELAFEILRFGLEANRSATLAALRRVLEMRFEDETADDPQGRIPKTTWEAHGRLGANTRRQVNRDAWNLVLEPLLRGLLHDETAPTALLQAAAVS